MYSHITDSVRYFQKYQVASTTDNQVIILAHVDDPLGDVVAPDVALGMNEFVLLHACIVGSDCHVRLTPNMEQPFAVFEAIELVGDFDSFFLLTSLGHFKVKIHAAA